MTSFTKYKQDLAPEGGYRPLNFARTFPKRFFTPTKLWILHLAPTTMWCLQYLYNDRYFRDLELENRSGDIALEPLLEAERDRAFLKYIRKNRDDERELMKDVPGWEVGKYYSNPVYYTVDDDKEWMSFPMSEYYSQTSQRELDKFFHFRHYH